MTGIAYDLELREDYLPHLSFATLLTKILKPRTLCIGKLSPAGEPQITAPSIAATAVQAVTPEKHGLPKFIARSTSRRPWHTRHTKYGFT